MFIILEIACILGVIVGILTPISLLMETVKREQRRDALENARIRSTLSLAESRETLAEAKLIKAHNDAMLIELKLDTQKAITAEKELKVLKQRREMGLTSTEFTPPGYTSDPTPDPEATPSAIENPDSLFEK